MICSTCGTENEARRKFCRECGSALAVACPNCGTANDPSDKFCGECGTPLAEGTPAAAAVRAAPTTPAGPVSERRLVSVLFADLVGFTALSETRDPDEVRDLLSRYFDLSRQVIARYGGTVEKFIGDAVMAVWGTPVAQEDDAERALRAALDLVQGVHALGEEIGAGLEARVGVMTGEASVTLRAEGQGMVAGDLVNTASRVQAVADPGTVLVGEATRRATEAAFVYEPAGTHELKGKAEVVPLYRAVRVIGARKGALRSAGLEAPFVGRDREFRLVKDVFHGIAEERRAHLLQIVGIAGIGKSRLGWEFYKYLDGLADTFLWHRGRCPAYGEGLTYWALADMVRGRADILEGEDPQAAHDKLRKTLAEYIADTEERSWVEPRLAHLLGLEERSVQEPEELFSAWRVFFERLTERYPVVMVFEDMQWADRSLLDFIDYLLNWSRNHPIFVMALARPEVAERHPEWAAPRRGTTALHLEPLSEEDMHLLLTGLIPDIPETLERQILDRAEGVPLYAMETVRMLVDRGLLELAPDGAAYRLAGPVETLEVPETLHALIAARLDGLTDPERSVLQDGAVVGKTFTKETLAAIAGLTETDVEPILAGLVRKEILFVQADPRSSERGQYGFLQDLVRRVAYERLSKKDRKARHLAAARHLEQTWGGEEVEIVEVVASHYLESYRLAPEAPDAPEIRSKARDALVGAGRRSESLAAPHQAYGYYAQAIDLTDDPVQRAELHERAGIVSFAAGRAGELREHLEKAIDLFEEQGEARQAARVVARLAEVAFADGRLEEASDRMEHAFQVLSREEPDETLATVASQQARMLTFSGQPDRALERVEFALQIAEELQLPEVLSQGLNTKAVLLGNRGRIEECLLLLRHALQVGLDNELDAAALRAYNNLSAFAMGGDRLEEGIEISLRGLELARRLGHRTWEHKLWLGTIDALVRSGRWDEAMALLEEFEASASAEDLASHQIVAVELLPLIDLHVQRGEIEEAKAALGRFADLERSQEMQSRASFALARARVLRAEGRNEEARAAAEEATPGLREAGMEYSTLRLTVVGVEASLSLGDLAWAEQRLAEIERLRPGRLSPSGRAQVARLRARLDATRGEHDAVDRNFQVAALEFRKIPMPFWLAVTLLEHGEWLVEQGRAEEAGPLLTEARGIFQELRARPWLERLEGAAARAWPAQPAARA